MGNFIVEYFDPTDPATHDLLAAIRHDLSITDINDRNRGGRQHQINLEAQSVLFVQVLERRVFLASGEHFPHPPGYREDSAGIAGQITSAIVVTALSRAIEEITGLPLGDHWNIWAGREASDDVRPAVIDLGLEILGLA